VADAETLLQPADEQQRQSDADHRQQQRQLRTRLATMRRTGLGASSLTTAELRLLPLMATHLTYPEIGRRLYVSRSTVKTQAISIYRKLGTSSRSQTVQRLQELGLLGA
jgi:LuxR family transcriptional regulator, maltose regulon positive regulatory protein